MSKIRVYNKENISNQNEIIKLFNFDLAKKIQEFHSSFKLYEQTPLVNLVNLAKKMGVKAVLVKDESKRFNLNAFKVLGGSYAVVQAIALKLGIQSEDISLEKLKSSEFKDEIKQITLITATDGNHGRGIAWIAKEIGCKAIIYMPYGATDERIKHITKLGAIVHKMDMTFDETARYAFEESKKNGYIMTQDTTFEGYESFPTWCMQGYTTMSYETYKQLQKLDLKPTHIFMQAGAGALAGSVAGFFANVYKEKRAFFTTIEASTCGCIFKTAKAKDGKEHSVDGDLETIMAGLSVGEVCSVGWKVLDDYADAYATCEDEIAAYGMRVLSSPIGDDERIISGESGSVGLGMVAKIMLSKDYAELKKQLNLDENSIILCFNTEGDTDPENYLKIVWQGAYPNE